MRYYFLIFIFFLSCCNNPEREVRKRMIYFQDTIKMRGTATGINDPEIIFSSHIFDTILIFKLFHTMQQPYRAYSLNTFRKIGDFPVTGKSHKEVKNPAIMSSLYDVKNGDIIISMVDFPTKILSVNLTQTLKTGRTVIDKNYDFTRPGRKNILFESNCVFTLGEGLFLMNKDPERSAGKENISPAPIYVLYDYNKDKCTDTLKYEYHINGADCMDKSMTKIVNTSYWEDIISIYDINTKTETILFHKKKSPGKLADPKNQSRRPDFTYWNCDIKDNMIFALYTNNGKSCKKEKEYSYIHIFNINGNPLYNIKTEEKIGNIVFDERTGTLYGLGYDEQLYAYPLKNILRQNTLSKTIN